MAPTPQHTNDLAHRRQTLNAVRGRAADIRRTGFFFSAILVPFAVALVFFDFLDPVQGLAFFCPVPAVIGWVVAEGRVREARRQFADRSNAEAHQQYHHRHEAELYEHARYRHELEEKRRVNAIPLWSAVTLPPTVLRLDLFGGTPATWRAAVAVQGRSVLENGHRLTVVDLSHRAVAADLSGYAAGAGLSTRTLAIPDDLSRLDLLTGLDTARIIPMLVGAMHHEDRSEAAFRDQQILEELSEALGAPFSVARLLGAVSALRGHQQVRPVLTDEEERFFAEDRYTYDERTAMSADLRRIDSYLRHLRDLGTRPDAADPAPALLTVTRESGHGAAPSRLYDDLLVQWLLHRVRTGAQAPGSTLLLAEADGLAENDLEHLSDLCDRHGVRLVTMFRALRDTAVRRAGRNAAVGFMQLGNHEEASVGADYIGRGYSFTLSQRIQTFGGGTNTSVGKANGPGPISRSHQDGTQENWSESRSEQEVYRYHVEPNILQSLPDGVILLVTHADGKPVMRGVECDPSIPWVPDSPGAAPAVDREPDRYGLAGGQDDGRLADRAERRREEEPG